jgi:Holliday junction resolvasome RuvABC ATP-dependent DNA helicase subunit
MIQLIYAKKGSGKTKRLIDLANAELNTTKGDVVFIDDDKRYIYDVKHQIRFVDVKDYGIDSYDSLYGLLCGMVAQNFDIEAVYIDAFLKIIGKDVTEIEGFIKKIENLAEKNQFKAVIIISADPAAAPDYLKGYII